MALNRVRISSPNYSSRGGSGVRLIVLHTSEGAQTYQSLGSFFANPSSGVSSHVGIDDTPNTVGEYVSRDNKAWTASNANPVAVQAELCTPSGAAAGWTTAIWNQHPGMLQNTAAWIAEEAAAFGIPIVKLTAQQAQGGSAGVCQHNDLGAWGGGHYDCGTGFPIDSVIAMASGGVPPKPPAPVNPPGLNAPMVDMAATAAGYYLYGADGGVFTYGDAPMYGSMGDKQLNAPVVCGWCRKDGSGYYMAAADGGVFTFGPNAPFLGSMGGTTMNAPVVGMADCDTNGYWLVGADGGVFAFGDAAFYGSMGDTKLNAPIVGAAAVHGGYYLVAADGGVFSFGAAQFYGGMGDKTLNASCVGMDAREDGSGYYLVAGDGGVFTFGPNAPFLGSQGGQPLNWPIESICCDPDGTGYWLSAADGGVFSFEAPFYGSAVK